MYFLIRYLMHRWRERQAEIVTASGGLIQADELPDVSGAGVGATVTGPAGIGGAARIGGSPRAGRVTRINKASAASRGPLFLFAHQCRYDLIASLRNPRARFMGLIFPLLLLVVFNGVFGDGYTTVDGVRVTLERFYVSGILAMSVVVNAYAGLVIAISTLRETGVLKRRRAAPIPAVVLIGGQAVATTMVTAISSAVLLLVARVLYGVGMAGPALLAVACVTLLGTLAFACVAYAVSGLIGSPEAAQPVVQLTMLPLWFISGVFIPVSSLSGGLRDVADVFPVEPLANSLHLASVHAGFASALSGPDLLVLAAWAVGAAGFAAWRFSWLPSGASA